MTELELSKKLREEAYEGGAEFAEFMVQAGKNAADPHSQPSSAKIERNEWIVIDADSTYQGYFADITRTVTLGGDTNKIGEDAYSTVLEAQTRAIELCGPDTEVGKVDAAARDYLREKNLAKYFLHRTGHGLGLEVHEAPYIVPQGRERLRAGMVFTVEPGVYLAGKYGIRIEDDVIVGEKGRKVSTDGVPKEFGWWR
jgi:Xaa-Pro dipeptidase